MSKLSRSGECTEAKFTLARSSKFADVGRIVCTHEIIRVLLHPLSFDIPLKERLLLRPTDARGIQMEGVNYRVGKTKELT